MASMMSMPAYEQARILEGQKYPKQGDAPHRSQYYMQALSGIRAYFAGDRSPQTIADYRRRIQQSRSQAHRKAHNLRALEAFVASDQPERELLSITSRAELNEKKVEEIQMRLRFDLVGREAGRQKCIFYNFQTVAIDAEIARTTLELAHWTLGGDVPLGDLEYVDLTGGITWKYLRPRKSTITKAQKNAKIIAVLWPSL